MLRRYLMEFTLWNSLSPKTRKWSLPNQILELQDLLGTMEKLLIGANKRRLLIRIFHRPQRKEQVGEEAPKLPLQFINRARFLSLARTWLKNLNHPKIDLFHALTNKWGHSTWQILHTRKFGSDHKTNQQLTKHALYLTGMTPFYAQLS